jgi:hypothetical protein
MLVISWVSPTRHGDWPLQWPQLLPTWGLGPVPCPHRRGAAQIGKPRFELAIARAALISLSSCTMFSAGPSRARNQNGAAPCATPFQNSQASVQNLKFTPSRVSPPLMLDDAATPAPKNGIPAPLSCVSVGTA